MTSQESNQSPERDQSLSRREGPDEDRIAPASAEEPDVFLDIPVLEVEEIDLEVDDLRAHVSVRAELAGLVNIDVGVDAYLNHLKLNVKGVEAQAQLRVRLDKILGTIDRALSAIEANPDLLNRQTGSERSADSPDGQHTERSAETAEQTQPQMLAIPGPAEAPLDQDEEPADDEGMVRTTEAARRKAEELGVDLARVRATGSGGRITMADVKRAANG